MTNRYIYITLLLSYISVGCIKEDNDNKSPACPSQFNLIYDWSHGESLLAYDSLMIIAPSGSNFMRTNNIGATLELIAGRYTAVAYEPSQTIRVQGTKLTLKVEDDGYAMEPGPMSAGLTTFIIGENTAGQQTLPMYYQTRELIVQVNFTGLGINMLSGVQGWLEGIAVSRDLAYGFPPLDGVARHPAITGGKITYAFAEKPQSATAKQFSASRRLLGIDGTAAQTLKLDFQFITGYKNTTIDVTSALDTFHTVKVFEPFVIVINILINEDFTADIVDWIAGSQSEIDAF